MGNFKTVPNQKVVTVNKVKCDKTHLYATINLEAMEWAAQSLDAGAFKLWVYFAKNQNGFEFALSSKDVLDTFGMKIRQYNSAVDELIEKGFLVRQGESNKYSFNEIAVNTKCNNDENCVITKEHNALITKCNNDVNTKCNNALLQNDIRNNTNITLDNTIDNTDGIDKTASLRSAVVINSSANQRVREQQAQIMTIKEATAKFGISACANRVKTALPNCYWINGELVKLV